MTKLDLKEIKASFARDGFVKVKGLFDKDLIRIY